MGCPGQASPALRRGLSHAAPWRGPSVPKAFRERRSRQGRAAWSRGALPLAPGRAGLSARLPALLHHHSISPMWVRSRDMPRDRSCPGFPCFTAPSMLTDLPAHGSGQRSVGLSPNLGGFGLVFFFRKATRRGKVSVGASRGLGVRSQLPGPLLGQGKKHWSQLGAAQHGAGSKQHQW